MLIFFLSFIFYFLGPISFLPLHVPFVCSTTIFPEKKKKNTLSGLWHHLLSLSLSISLSTHILIIPPEPTAHSSNLPAAVEAAALAVAPPQTVHPLEAAQRARAGEADQEVAEDLEAEAGQEAEEDPAAEVEKAQASREVLRRPQPKRPSWRKRKRRREKKRRRRWWW